MCIISLWNNYPTLDVIYIISYVFISLELPVGSLGLMHMTAARRTVPISFVMFARVISCFVIRYLIILHQYFGVQVIKTKRQHN